ncbi:MAG TPA: hypothetical protein VG406_03035 [Isosphaeraceae bacterium]|nr:hypothetical protein [Isosphaeraceae bacterium]
MNLRLVHCPACRTAYMIEDEAADRPPPCPKCGATPNKQSVARRTDDEGGPTVFVPSTPSRRRGRKVAAMVIAAAVVVAVAAVVAWPMIRGRWRRAPADPIESTATTYLRALIANDAEATRKLGTVELPPAIRSFRDLRREPPRIATLRGSFAPISALHARIDESYTFDPSLGRYTPRNALGPAAEVLDALHDAKAKAEVDGIAKKIESGSPDDLFDAAEGLGKTFTNLAEGVLSPKKLLPTYAMLVDDAKPPLPLEEKALAKEVADHHAAWDALLGRPFMTLKADGPFLLERAEVTASVVDALGSAGDPPTPLRMTLTRFRLEGIDTGWRVTSARREGKPGGKPLDSSSSAAKN